MWTLVEKNTNKEMQYLQTILIWALLCVIWKYIIMFNISNCVLKIISVLNCKKEKIKTEKMVLFSGMFLCYFNKENF